VILNPGEVAREMGITRKELASLLNKNLKSAVWTDAYTGFMYIRGEHDTSSMFTNSPQP